MSLLLLAVLCLVAQIYLASRFGLALIYEIAMVAFGVLWVFQSDINPAIGPASAFLAALPAWQLAVCCALLGMVLRFAKAKAPTRDAVAN